MKFIPQRVALRAGRILRLGHRALCGRELGWREGDPKHPDETARAEDPMVSAHALISSFDGRSGGVPARMRCEVVHSVRVPARMRCEVLHSWAPNLAWTSYPAGSYELCDDPRWIPSA